MQYQPVTKAAGGYWARYPIIIPLLSSVGRRNSTAVPRLNAS